MAEEEFLPYKDISELKKELAVMKGKKDVSVKDLSDAVVKLSQIMSDMLEIFGAAAEQLKLEEREYGMESKKLDKLLDQNKTIAEGMVSLVELINKKAVHQGETEDFKPKEEAFFKPRPEPKPFMKPQQQEWQQPQPAERAQQAMPPLMPPPQMTAPYMPPISPPDTGMQMPPMEPTPLPELDLPGEPFEFEEEPKKKGLFGMFKK